MLKPILRLLRRKTILMVIFLSSFTYSMVMLFGRSSTRSNFDHDTQDDVIDIDRVRARLSSSKQNLLGSDPSNSLESNIIPKVDFLHDFNPNKEESSLTDKVTPIESCRNSVQGKVLIADDRGYLCSRRDLQANGCCSPSSKQYSCETCLTNDCCAIYEQCISCCMHPQKRPLLQKIVSNGVNLAVIFSSVTDHFEFCLAKCRTSSQSVQHENSYRDPRAKHCYGENLPFNSVTKENKVTTSVPMESSKKA